MEKIVLDTSVVVKWFVNEKDSKKALQILDDYRQGKVNIIAPEIVVLELVNALFFGANLKGKLLEAAISTFYALGITLVPLNKFLIDKTRQQMEKTETVAYDALFLALAKSENLPLISADKKHHVKKFYRRIRYLS